MAASSRRSRRRRTAGGCRAAPAVCSDGCAAGPSASRQPPPRPPGPWRCRGRATPAPPPAGPDRARHPVRSTGPSPPCGPRHLGDRAAARPQMRGDIFRRHPQGRGRRVGDSELGGKGGADQCGNRRGVPRLHRAQRKGRLPERHRGTVARTANDAYVGAMSDTPAFLDSGRPPVPDIVVPRGVTPFFLPRRPVRGRLVRLGPLAHALLTRHPNHPAVTRLAGPVAGAGGGAVHGAEVPRLVQPAGEGRRTGDDAARRLHRYRRAAWLCPRRTGQARGAAAGRSLAGGRSASRQRLPGVHRRSGAGPEPPPGHRDDRGRQSGRNGAALLPHQRAAALLRAPRVRGNPRTAGAPGRWFWRRSPAPAASTPSWTTTRRRKAGAPRPRWPPP